MSDSARTGRRPPISSLALSDAADEYLTYLAVDRARSPQTTRAYATDLASALGFWIGLKRPPALFADLSRDHVRAYQRHLGQSGLALSSRARRLQTLRGFLRYALREGWLEEDLGAHIDIPRVSAPLPKPLTTADARSLLDHDASGSEPDLRDQALIHFLLSTGCRISEALAVNRSDLNSDGRLVVRGKGSKERVVHLTPAAMTAISAYLGARHDRDPALFVNYDHRSLAVGARRLTAAGARHIVARLRRERGVEALRSPHVLRHTTATELLTITGNVRLVQEVLGHANLNTMQGYTKVVDQARTDAYREFSRRLAPRHDVKGSD
ncbi:MAG: tyrosine-type recombinase/integrase [Candidatus Dormibacteria bacterium]